MSSFTVSAKKTLLTWLDDAGQMLDLPRLEDESLHLYKQRLIDFVKNKSNSSVDGTNNSLARSVGLNRSHILSIEAIEGIDKPYIEITSKYLRLVANDIVELEIDLYSNTIAMVKLLIDNTKSSFFVSYYDEDFAEFSAKKLCYNNNFDSTVEYLNDSKLNILKNSHVLDYIFSAGVSHRHSVDTIDDIDKIEDFYVDMISGFVYTGQNAVGYLSYTYYDIPFKIYYSPVTFYPLNDKDIDKIMKDPVITSDGSTEEVLNVKGARFVNQCLAKSPIHWGE